MDDYIKVRDSLKLILKNRISEARRKPLGLGDQIENAKEWGEPKNIHSQSKNK